MHGAAQAAIGTSISALFFGLWQTISLHGTMLSQGASLRAVRYGHRLGLRDQAWQWPPRCWKAAFDETRGSPCEDIASRSLPPAWASGKRQPPGALYSRVNLGAVTDTRSPLAPEGRQEKARCGRRCSGLSNPSGAGGGAPWGLSTSIREEKMADHQNYDLPNRLTTHNYA